MLEKAELEELDKGWRTIKVIMTLAKAMPVKTLAFFVNEHDTRLWRIPIITSIKAVQRLTIKTSKPSALTKLPAAA